MAQVEAKIETATFGGGCFWCTEAVFESVKGVESVEPGYCGGEIINPSYRDVCSGLTGHVEVIQITFDPSVVSYKQLLHVFFATHDPTTLNRQGADVGTQYRSVIFYHNSIQKDETENIIKLLTKENIFNAPIVTELLPVTKFYKAEDYHQDYFKKNPQQPYCQIVINPKINKFKEKYRDWLK